MPTQFRNYCKEAGITEDYRRVRDFFLEVGDPSYSFARWDWMATHGMLDREAVGRIGLWEDGGRIVGVATFDTVPGEGFLYTLSGYGDLKREMLGYARENLKKDGTFRVMIPDRDAHYQQIALEEGFVATPDRQFDAVYPLNRWRDIRYELPAGFSVVSLGERCDLYQYGRVLWKGFNHELEGRGAYAPTDEQLAQMEKELHRPNVNLDIKIAVVAPDGNFASYCGMWCDPKARFCQVEPVATDPAYRKLGLGKAAVLEGIRRCGELGAEQACVGSSQQFYYSIGFRPALTGSWWVQQR